MPKVRSVRGSRDGVQRPFLAQELRLRFHVPGDVGLGRVSKLWRSERSWVAQCRGTEVNGSLRAIGGRVVALVEGSSVNVKVRNGGLHVLRVGDERSCMALFLPRASGQSGCDRLIFMLLRERHALNCGRPLRAERMVESKWISRYF